MANPAALQRTQEKEFLSLKPWQKFVIGLGLSYSLIYFYWRATITIHEEHLLYSWSFFAADVLGFVNSIFFMFATWRLRSRVSVEPKRAYSVDVYIPTYNESAELLWTTIYHAKKMDYEHETYVLDDGARSEIRALAESMGVKYISRPDNKGAKAGNINHALGKTFGDLVVILDADGIARRDFLTKTLGYFDDPKTALVQTPNAFYNLDSFQHWVVNAGKNTWHEQALWFDVIQRGLDSGGAAMWCGSGSVLRREALLKVGGVATESVTEDALTTLLLHKAGYQSVFHDEPIAFNLAPSTIDPFLVQRGRWAMGAVQILRSRIFDIIGPSRLSLLQRVAYIMTLYYFAAFQKIIYYVSPLIFLMFGISPVNQPDKFVFPLLGYMIASGVIYKILARGSGKIFRAEVYFMHLVPVYVKAIIFGLIPFLKVRFKVTPKESGGTAPLRDWVFPTLVLVVSVIAIVSGVFQVMAGKELDLGIGITILAAIYYGTVSVFAFFDMYRVPISETTNTFFDFRPLLVTGRDGADDLVKSLGVAFMISDERIRFVNMGSFKVRQNIQFDLDLPDTTLGLRGTVRQCEPWVVQGVEPLFAIEIELNGLTPGHRTQLSRYYFEDATPKAMNTIANIVREKPTDHKRRKSVRRPALIPVVASTGQNFSTSNVGLLDEVSLEGARIKFPAEIAVGQKIQLQMPWIKKTLTATVARCQRDKGQMNPPFDIGVVFDQDIKREASTLSEIGKLKLAIA